MKPRRGFEWLWNLCEFLQPGWRFGRGAGFWRAAKSARKGAFGGRFLLCEHELIVLGADLDGFAVMEGAFQDLFRQRIFQEALDRPAHRTRAVLRVVPFADEEVFGFLI